MSHQKGGGFALVTAISPGLRKVAGSSQFTREEM